MDSASLPSRTSDAFDKRAFSELFFDREANRHAIFHGIAEICLRASKRINLPSPDMVEDLRQEALIEAMRLVDAIGTQPGRGYDPTKRKAYDYFYTVVTHHMGHLAKEISRRQDLGDADQDVSTEREPIAPIDVAAYARKNSVNNWRSFRVHCPICEMHIAKYFGVAEEKINRAQIAAKAKGAAGVQELAVLRVQMQALRQGRRALLG